MPGPVPELTAGIVSVRTTPGGQQEHVLQFRLKSFFLNPVNHQCKILKYHHFKTFFLIAGRVHFSYNEDNLLHFILGYLFKQELVCK